jgi:hypothetical protein
VPDYYQTFYRNYDPTLGRFIGVDPMAEGSETMGVYHYAGDNPVMGNDPGGDMLANPNAEQYIAQDNALQGAYQNMYQGPLNGGGAIIDYPDDNSSGTTTHDVDASLEQTNVAAPYNGNVVGGPMYITTIFNYSNGTQLQVLDGSNAVYNVGADGSLHFSGYQQQPGADGTVNGGIDAPNFITIANFLNGNYVGITGLVQGDVTIAGESNRKEQQSNQIGGNAAESTRQLSPGFNISAAINYLDENAYSHYIKGKCGHCALHVRQALQAGGINTAHHPVFAKNYGPYLMGWGFENISPTDYTPFPGDIRVWQSYPGGNPAGHIDMFNGSNWGSDFIENGVFPGRGYSIYPNYQIFRWPDQ